MNHHFDPRWADGGWWLWGIVPLLMLLLLGGLIVWAVLRLSRPVPAAMPPAPPLRDPVLEEVRLRYARGEIDREEFLQRSRDLGAPQAEASGGDEPPGVGPPSG